MHDGHAPKPESRATEATGADHGSWMSRGTELHAAGQLEQALLAFENALALAPNDVNTASACATLLALLDRPQAAFQTLLSVEAQLLESADGAANLAIAAEACGALEKAEAAYTQALRIDPSHVRSLNNVGILAASASQWQLAITLARKCLALQAGHAGHHANLAEFLAGDGQYPEALELVAAARQRFPDDRDLVIRHTALLAVNGELEKCNAALAGMDAEERRLLEKFLSKAGSPRSLLAHAGASPDRPPPASLDALDLHLRQALANMFLCDWRGNTLLADLVRRALAASAAQVQAGRDWDEAPLHGLTLGLQESELRQMRGETGAAMQAGLNASLPPFAARSPARGSTTAAPDQRMRVGLALQSLRDVHQVQALARQLANHDASRFAFFIYAFTERPDPALADGLRPHVEGVNELAHMLDVEAAARMRLDRLDIYVETEGDFGWSRPAIAAWRVAPVQLRQRGWHQYHVAAPWDYTLSDRFIHPDTDSPTSFGAIARLPHTCWLATRDAAHAGLAGASREDAGLPAGVLVLASSATPAMLDPDSFSAWMKILRSLPDAILWLPACGVAAAHLAREAQAAGVGASRVFFQAATASGASHAHLGHADIFLDPLRCCAAAGLEAALRLGVPALTCAGAGMASRLGASMCHAAGLPQVVFDNKDAYVAGTVRLGRDAEALLQLRARLRDAVPGSALLDTAARIREWEAAWELMVQRSRAGLAPAGFDVPSSIPVQTP
jgi:protein O-GlcNAc transferase